MTPYWALEYGNGKGMREWGIWGGGQNTEIIILFPILCVKDYFFSKLKKIECFLRSCLQGKIFFRISVLGKLKIFILELFLINLHPLLSLYWKEVSYRLLLIQKFSIIHPHNNYSSQGFYSKWVVVEYTLS